MGRAKSIEQKARRVIFLCMKFAVTLALSQREREFSENNPKSKIQNYLMTLSAFISVHCGIVRPICLAVFKLITNSNFIGCSTGKSAGLVPFRILSTKYATRR